VRVLYVVTRSPHDPRKGDQRRSFHLIEHLARRHDITVAVLSPTLDEADLTGIGRLGVEVAHLPVRGWWRLAGFFLDRRPFQVLPFAGSGVRKAMTSLADGKDLVHGHLIRSVPALPEGTPVVVDLVDAMSLNMQRRAEHDRLLGWAARWEAGRMSRYERLVTERFATIVAAADDAAHLGGSPAVVPNGVDLEQFPLSSEGRAPATVVFAGNLGYFPNADSAAILAEQVMPSLRRLVPDAVLVLAGSSPGSAVLRLADEHRVRVVADPADLGAIVAAATVAVVPMRAGTGIQNKVLEAMAVGTPVVTTDRVASATGAVDHEHVVVAEGTEEMAGAAAMLINDPPEAARIAGNARRLVEADFTWEAAARGVEAVWRRAVGG
jgi:glycosyltransferase involved in cell wall biosynthesis